MSFVSGDFDLLKTRVPDAVSAHRKLLENPAASAASSILQFHLLWKKSSSNRLVIRRANAGTEIAYLITPDNPVQQQCWGINGTVSVFTAYRAGKTLTGNFS